MESLEDRGMISFFRKDKSGRPGTDVTADHLSVVEDCLPSLVSKQSWAMDGEAAGRREVSFSFGSPAT